MKKLDIQKGDRYGRLVVLEEVEQRPQRNGRMNRFFECLCDCGETTVVRLHDMRHGATTSCGCYGLEVSISHVQNATEANITHGMTGTKTYRVWMHIIQRCCNTNDKNFFNYGGRGIKICDRWKDSFENFLEDMGEMPEGRSIDRINNNGNYEKENCRWATMKEQTRNKRSNKFLSFNRETLCYTDWAKKIGINKGEISRRINILGWNIEKTLTTPGTGLTKAK